jgi:hypothetical protein
MKRVLSFGLLGSLILSLTGCAVLPPADGSGLVVMTPYANHDLAVRGVMPWGWIAVDSGQWIRGETETDMASLVQVSIPEVTRDEAIDLFLTQLGLESLPDSTGTYRSPHLEWTLFDFEMEQAPIGVLTVRGALAEGDSACYAILLAAPAADYEEDRALFDTIFVHAVHGLAPLD